MSYPIPAPRARKMVNSMDMLRLRAWSERNESYWKALHHGYNITQLFYDDLRKRSQGDAPDHVILQIYGPTNSGKSYTGMALALDIMGIPAHKIHIAFSHQELLRKGKKAQMGDVMISDEQPLRVGIGSKREAYEMINLEEVTRKFRLHFIFISPTRRMHGSTHYHLRTIYKDVDTFTNRCAVIDPGSDKCLGWMEVKIDQKNALAKAYERKKDKFIDKVTSQDQHDNVYMEYAREFMKKPEYPHCTKKSQIKAMLVKFYPNLTNQERYYIAEYVGFIEKGVFDA